MENWLLIAVGVIFLVSVVWGLSQGFLRIAVSLAASILTIIVVGVIAPKVGQMIQERTTIDDSIMSAVSSAISPQEDLGEPETEEAQEEAGQQAEPSHEEQLRALESSSFPGFLQDALMKNNNSGGYREVGAGNFYDYVSLYVARTIINIVSFLAVYAVLRIFVRILLNMIDFISELPVLNGINRLAGGITGIGVGVVIVWIFFLILTLVYATSFGQGCLSQINASPILSALYENNQILRFLL